MRFLKPSVLPNLEPADEGERTNSREPIESEPAFFRPRDIANHRSSNAKGLRQAHEREFVQTRSVVLNNHLVSVHADRQPVHVGADKHTGSRQPADAVLHPSRMLLTRFPTTAPNPSCSRTAEAIVTGKVRLFSSANIPNDRPPVGPPPGPDRPEATKPRSLMPTPDSSAFPAHPPALDTGRL